VDIVFALIIFGVMVGLIAKWACDNSHRETETRECLRVIVQQRASREQRKVS
jgi:hypothetical protein